MTLDGLLTFLALVVAVFALMPIERRWMVTLRGPLVWISSGVALALTVYLELFASLAQPCPTKLGSTCRWLELTKPGGESFGRLSSAQAAFLVVATWLAVAAWVTWRQKVDPGALKRLAEIVAEKLSEGQHEAVVLMVEPNLGILDRTAGQRLMGARLRERIRRLDPDQRDVMLERIKAGDKRVVSWHRFRGLAAKARLLVPYRPQVEAAAHDVLRAVFTTPQIANFLATARPKVGVGLLRVSSSRFVYEFSKSLFRRMLENPLSHLYRELPLNENISSREGYWLPAHNIYLHYLFADARHADRLGVCDDLSLAVRDLLRDDAYARSLNRTARGFSDDGKWRDPMFATLRMFDIQARAVAFQGLRSHGSAFEMTHLLEALLATYAAGGEGVDPHDEWPMRADFLIYTLIDALTAWAELPQHLDGEALHVQLEDEGTAHQNDSVPKSAMLAIGTCLRSVTMCEAMPARQRNYIFEVILRSVADYPLTPELAKFRRAYIRAIVDGGWAQGVRKQAYRQALEVLFHDQDHVLQDRARDFAAAL